MILLFAISKTVDFQRFILHLGSIRIASGPSNLLAIGVCFCSFLTH